MKKALFILVFPTLFFCQNKNELSEVYKELGIPYFMRSHVPKSIHPKEYSITFNTVPVNNIARTEYVYFYLKIKNTLGVHFKDSISQISVYNTVFSDSCNISPLIYQKNDSYYNQEGKNWLYAKWKERVTTCKDTVLPIPSFIGVYNQDDSYKQGRGLPDVYEIFVLESKQGREFADKYYENVNYQLPSGWEHGFTRGVAISEKTVIYFFTAW